MRDCGWRWLNDAKRIVTAAGREVFEHSVSLVLFAVAAGGCKTHCNGYMKTNWVTEATEEVIS